MAVTMPGTMPDTYFKLVRRFPLTRITDENDAVAAQAMIDELTRKKLDVGEQAYLDVLTDLFEAYEEANVPIADASEADVLRGLMLSNRLSQPALAKKTGIAQSTISAVLNGSRSLTKHQIVALAKFFKVGPGAFLPT